MKLKCNKAPFAAEKLGLDRPGEETAEAVHVPVHARHTSPNQGVNKRGHPGAAQERGVALVVTLILLAVITFMAITFLVVSRSERGSVSTTTDQAIARLAADAALEYAKADLLAPIMAKTNSFLVGMIVSTNFINRYGFMPGSENPTNVNFDYKGPDGNGGALSMDEQRQNLANLLYRPRVPVFMRDRTNGNDVFQYYLDINRSGRHEPSGWQVVTNNQNLPVLDGNNDPVLANFTGDPEWIGGLEFPNERHSGANRFIYRFAYMVAPVGQTLDLNAMHNAARLRLPANLPADEFVRNQGVGTWEMNMGAFLTDLNTNLWYVGNPGYLYDVSDLGRHNRGAGFDDATALLRYRYGGTRNTLWTPTGLLGTAGAAALDRDAYDAFGNGDGFTVQNNTAPYALDPDAVQTRASSPWPGSYNTNLFYSPMDLYDRAKTGGLLTDRLLIAATNNSSYDRYTFQRLLEQLGTESAPEENKININYDNIVNGQVVPNYQTNFIAWANNPAEFFTNAANRLLDNAGFAFTVTNIQVWPTNHYTPSVHRALQLAANLYDATSSRTFPSVFRPLFEVRTVNGRPAIYIKGYAEVQHAGRMTDIVFHDPLMTNTSTLTTEMIAGVPLIVGVKKNLPNFNEFGMDTKLVITRKLEFKRLGGSNTGPISETNQMITVSMTNNLGLEAWNSYRKRLQGFGNVNLTAHVDAFVWMTNTLGGFVLPTRVISTNSAPPPFTDTQNGSWDGWTRASQTITDFSMVSALTNLTAILEPSTFSDKSQRFIRLTADFDDNNGFPIQDWKLNVRLRVRFEITGTDPDTGQIRYLDFVNLADFKTYDIASLLQMENQEDTAACGVPYRPYDPSASEASMWCTNRENGTLNVQSPTYGVLNQITVAGGVIDSGIWQKKTNIFGINFFRHQFGWGLLAGTLPDSRYTKTNTFYAPYSPTRELYLVTKWQANDPLVHYTPGDLFDQGKPYTWSFNSGDSAMLNMRRVNGRYEPYVLGTGSSSPTAYDLSLKDTLVFGSDYWDFPTNKFPNIGWIGRVHRGTPWQTVYLKSQMANTNTWNKWAGSYVAYTNLGQVKFSLVRSNDVARDSLFSMPFQDWALLDMFSASLVDNATRGQLSINQPGLAAWSAVLSGVPVLTNLMPNAFTNIQPAAVDPALQVIVDGINKTRAARPEGVFRHLGEICSVPELTVKSPYIQNVGDLGDRNEDVVSDAVYERIPQQILGLLRCESTPRFVVYSYGQALKPANGSLVTSGAYSQMATNYQVTAEVATRAVVRVDGAPENPQVVIENFNVLPPD